MIEAGDANAVMCVEIAMVNARVRQVILKFL